MNKLNTELKNKAVSLGLCAKWTSEWSERDKDELCEMYIRGLDFCIEHDYPSRKYMMENFSGVMENHGIYVDADFDEKFVKGILVLNGDCHGDIIVKGYDVATIHVRHDSFIRITITDHAKAFIKVYDNAVVQVIQEGESKAYLYRKGGSYKVSGDVLVR
jgi:hypothetical protein